MGPSGYGFTHPSVLAPQEPIRQSMVNLTAQAAASLDMQAFVHWDEYDNNVSMSVSLAELDVVAEIPASYKQWHMPATTDKSSSYSKSSTGSIGAQQSGSADVQPNKLAMEQYIAQFANSSIQAVFSPIMPYVHKHIDGIVTFREWIRWTDSSVASPANTAEALLKFPKGLLGYVYKLPDISMHEVELLGKALQETHVKLVGYRELTSLAVQANDVPQARALHT